MRIFHLGDLHIGKSVNGFSMIDDQKFVLKQLYINIDKEKPDVVIIAGDIFDRSVPSIEAVELADEMFIEIAIKRNTPIIAIAGNHDGKERIDYLSRFAKESGLYLTGTIKKEPERIILPSISENVVFYPIPYAKPVVIRELFEDNNIKSHDDGMKKIIGEIKKDIDDSKINIAIAHGHIGSVNSEGLSGLEESKSEKPLEIGGTDMIDSGYFDVFDYTALGHLHAPQKVKSDKIRYSGSLLKYSFSEVNQKKGITLIDIDDEGNLSVNIIEFKPRRNMRIIKGKLNEILENSQLDTKSSEDYIRVELEDEEALIDPMSKLRSVYPNVMELGKIDSVNRLSKDRKIVATNIKEKTSLKLFEEFYEDIIGDKCQENKLEIMRNIIETVEKEREKNEN